MTRKKRTSTESRKQGEAVKTDSESIDSVEAHIDGEIVEDKDANSDASENNTDSESERVSEDLTKSKVSTKSLRTLTITAYAPLQVTPTANYLRYGMYGVRRFGPGAPTEHTMHVETITISLRMKQVTDNILLEFDNLILRTPHPETPSDLEGSNIWIGEHAASHLQIMWVWDFYRLHSGIQLTIELPPEDDKNVSPAWQEASTAFRSLEAGDQLIVEARNRSGNILQIYPVDAGAFDASD